MSSRIRSMRRAMNKAGKKAVARQVHIFSGLYDEVKKVCLDINTAMVEQFEAGKAGLSDKEQAELPENPQFQFIEPSTFIHTVLANAVNGYWVEKKAAEGKAEGKGLIQLAGGEVAAKIKAGERKIEREKA